MNIINYILSLNFLPHGHCFAGDRVSLFLNIIGNIAIFLAYMLIPLGLFFILKKQKAALDKHKTIILLFITFIFSCGISHLFDVIVVWYPYYRLQTYWTLWTGLISMITAALLLHLIKHIKIKEYKLFDKTIQITEIELPPKKLK